MLKFYKNRITRAFTLVESLVALSLISGLASVGYVGFVEIKASSKATGVQTQPEYDYSQLGETWSSPRIFRLPTDGAKDKDIINNNYLRINSPIGKINKMLDDNSEENLEKIHLMGLDWWSEYKESVLNFIED